MNIAAAGPDSAMALILLLTMLVFGLVQASGASNPGPTELLAQADSSFDARNFEAAIALYKEALTAAEAKSDVSTQIEALSQLARSHLTQGLFEGAHEWLGKADAIASDKYPGYARYLGVKGRLEWREGRNDSASIYFQQMYTYSKSIGLTARTIDACRMMAIVGTPEEQISWGRRGIAEAEAAGLPKELPSLWNNLAASLGDQKKFDEAYEAFVKARDYHWQYGSETGKLFADYQVGWALRMKGAHDQAMTWLRPSLAWAERLGNEEVQAQACQDIGEIYAAKKDPAAALTYLRRSLALFVKLGYREHSPQLVSDLEKRIAGIESQ